MIKQEAYSLFKLLIDLYFSYAMTYSYSSQNLNALNSFLFLNISLWLWLKSRINFQNIKFTDYSKHLKIFRLICSKLELRLYFDEFYKYKTSVYNNNKIFKTASSGTNNKIIIIIQEDMILNTFMKIIVFYRISNFIKKLFCNIYKIYLWLFLFEKFRKAELYKSKQFLNRTLH